MPEAEQVAWVADHLESPQFLNPDEPFESWRRRFLDGEWAGRHGPVLRLRDAVVRCRAVSRQATGAALFRSEDNPLLAYPVAENTKALTDARIELYRLVGDDMDGEVLKALAARVGCTLSEPTKRMKSLCELLPAHLRAEVHTPLRDLASDRNEIHRSASDRPAPCAAFDTFDREAAAIAHGLERLCEWIAAEYRLDPEACLQREEIMTSPLWPGITAPPQPKQKLSDVQSIVGKTVEAVEYGIVERSRGSHEWEAIVIHFTDGSALRLDVGCNAGNLDSTFPGLKASMFRTSLDPTLIPSARIPPPAP